MIENLLKIIVSLPDNPDVKKEERQCGIQFTRYGLWVIEWVSTVGETFPKLFQIPTRYLDDSSFLNTNKLQDLIAQDPSTWPLLPYCESLFLHVAESFCKVGPKVKEAMAHIVFTSMLVATSKAPSDALPKSLSCYNDLMFFQTFVAQVNSMISSINGIQLKVRGNDAAPMLALACFAVAGVRGLLLGPSSNCTCSPSGAAQHISLIALSTIPIHIGTKLIVYESLPPPPFMGLLPLAWTILLHHSYHCYIQS
ncbi:uncharacterized protein PGTG_06953 [Puccinia graminis f. sp. tritici CRL 75-36-700-3]|uniref:Uncharacterized protein n=1 Tax=Puccinia graminis f. sp. tritici (strain CRL 75-36-700-3 / race SCCL) TaxID=418459 RepID=E3KAM0_PUCGT|nr:uncharacterized protein PGTG_06953 [Puccinia graminis f. sp. tritici CRL 75-36-700-3]EFP81332.1 hypothetical protein PGTG_06953 [Puccinia graminis f. sp. tritici CRL 75-36-700-3]